MTRDWYRPISEMLYTYKVELFCEKGPYKAFPFVKSYLDNSKLHLFAVFSGIYTIMHSNWNKFENYCLLNVTRTFFPNANPCTASIVSFGLETISFKWIRLRPSIVYIFKLLKAKMEQILQTATYNEMTCKWLSLCFTCCRSHETVPCLMFA